MQIQDSGVFHLVLQKLYIHFGKVGSISLFCDHGSLVIWVWGTNNHMVLSNKSQYEHFPGHFSQVYEKISSQLKIW